MKQERSHSGVVSFKKGVGATLEQYCEEKMRRVQCRIAMFELLLQRT